MKTRFVRIRDISKDDEDAWRRLAERALEPNPFAEADFLMLSSRHFAGYAEARLVIVQDGSEFSAVLPICRIRSSRMPPGKVASIRSVPGIAACLDTPLVDRSDPDQASRGLLDALHRAARSGEMPGMVLFDQISGDGPVVESLRRACKERHCPVFVKDSWERATVSRAGQWANPVDGKRRREIGRTQRLLEKYAGQPVTLVDRTSDPAAVEEFLKMEISGWKGREGGRALDGKVDTAAWFRDWHHHWSAAGRLTVLSLNLGSIPIAMLYFARAGDGLFAIRTAFDEEYAKFGPGAILMFSAINYLRDNTDAAWIDSWTDKDNVFTLAMMPERRRLATLLIGTGGALDRALVSALPAMTKLVAVEKHVWKRFHRVPST